MLPAMYHDQSDRSRHNQPHDELHIVHMPLPGPAGSPEPPIYRTVVRRGDDQPPLSVNDVIEMLTMWRPISTEFHGWSLLVVNVMDNIEPRSIKVVATIVPRDDSRWSDIINPRMRIKTFYAAYDEAAPLIDAVLPRRWSWFATRVAERASGKQMRWTGRRTPLPPIREEPLYREIETRIEALAKADDAIWGTAKRFSVTSLARDLGMPRRTFERRIAEWNTGVSPADIIQEMRLAVAHELLPLSATVKAVANRTGYSQSHFTKLYRPRYGVNPSECTK